MLTVEAYLCEVRMTEVPSLMRPSTRSHKKRREHGSIPVVGSSLSGKKNKEVALV